LERVLLHLLYIGKDADRGFEQFHGSHSDTDCVGFRIPDRPTSYRFISVILRMICSITGTGQYSGQSRLATLGTASTTAYGLSELD